MRCRTLSIFSLLLLPSLAHAWGGDGHQLVCLIAEDRLTPAANAAVHKMVGANNYMSDAEFANWADQIRNDRPETGPWHYADIPLEAPAFDEKRDGAAGNNIVDQINHFVAVLKDPKASKEEHLEALKFVAHLVGDAHQPLHCVERNHDKGGNMRLVWFPGRDRASNLHSVWDSAILLKHMGDARNLAYSDKLNAQITPQEAAEWAKGTPVDWVNESHEVAVKSVYPGIAVDGPPPKLTDAYINAAGLVIDRQLERGGIRLATILNGVYR